MSGQQTSLPNLQQWMMRVITHPAGVIGGIDSDDARQHIDVDESAIETVVLPSQTRSSVERLDVYSYAYIARLLECLRDEFPATTAAFGEEAFNSLAFDYLQACPPHSYTLAELGRGFPQFLKDSRPDDTASEAHGSWTDFLIDLATLERTFAEVFDCRGPESNPVLNAAAISEVAPEDWPAARLIAFPCVRVLKFSFPVHRFASDIRKGVDEPEVPSSRAVYLAISRREFIVRQDEISETQFHLLDAILDGVTIGEAVMKAAESTEEPIDSLAANLSEWFQSWSAAQFFQGIG